MQSVKELVVWFLVTSVVLVQSSNGCGVLMLGLGTVNPLGDVEEKVGSTLRLECTLNESLPDIQPGSSKNIIWKKNGILVSSDSVRVLDNYTAELMVKNVIMEDSGMYVCMLNKSVVPRYICHNQVMIGAAPLNVVDFSCVAPNWDYLYCTFTKPKNPVKTTYELLYHSRINIRGRACWLNPVRGTNLTSCTINQLSELPYIQEAANYYFTLSAKNSFGEKRWKFNVAHFNRVKPNPPRVVINNGWNSTSLTLDLFRPPAMQMFPNALEYRIFYRSQWDSNGSWTVLRSEKNVSLVDLQPYTNYTFNVQIKPTAAEELLWSGNTSVEAVTMADVPDMPPKLASGSFQQNVFSNSRDVILFWQMIPRYEQNGPKFGYTVTATPGIIPHQVILPENISENSATFRNLSLEIFYTFSVRSVNEVGSSKFISRTTVKEYFFMPEGVKSLTVISFENGVYELSWQPPSSYGLDYMTSYTLFWCPSIKLDPFPCSGNLSWIYVGPRPTAYNVSLVDKHVNYHFAVEKTFGRTTSGMVWATCYVSHDEMTSKKIMTKVNLTPMGTTRIRVSWKPDCSYRIGIITAFKIYYCPVLFDSPTAPCIGRQRYVYEKGSEADRCELRFLDAGTLYKVTVSAITRAGEGERSVARVERTYENRSSQLWKI